jgi:hypothetical protein
MSDATTANQRDNDQQQQQALNFMPVKLFQLLSTVYGPYAFGMVSLLIVWFFIVAPQLDRQQIDYEKNEKVVESLRSVATSMEAISRSMERTATILDAVVKRVEP